MAGGGSGAPRADRSAFATESETRAQHFLERGSAAVEAVVGAGEHQAVAQLRIGLQCAEPRAAIGEGTDVVIGERGADEQDAGDDDVAGPGAQVRGEVAPREQQDRREAHG